MSQVFVVQAPLRQHVPIPHRNLMLASLAASYAAQLEVGAVMLALNREDLGAYSTASSSFLAATDATYKVRLNIHEEVIIILITPIVTVTRTIIIVDVTLF